MTNRFSKALMKSANWTSYCGSAREVVLSSSDFVGSSSSRNIRISQAKKSTARVASVPWTLVALRRTTCHGLSDSFDCSHCIPVLSEARGFSVFYSYNRLGEPELPSWHLNCVFPQPRNVDGGA